MKHLKPSINRFLAISLALLIQVGFIASMSSFFEEAAGTINTIVRIMSIILVLYIISEKSNNAIKTAWIVFIFITPVFGGMMYLLLGGKRPQRWLRKSLENAWNEHTEYRQKNSDVSERLKNENEVLYTQSKYTENLGYPLYENTDAEYFELGEKALPAMLEAMEKAEKFIFLEYFIVADGEMLDAFNKILMKKAREGVEVRFIYDDMGSLFTITKRQIKKMQECGIKCHRFNPYRPVISAAMNNRDHRKILVVDNRIAFTGGINIADEYINRVVKFGHWKDNCVKLEGDGVREFTLMFLDMWNAFSSKGENIARFLEKSVYKTTENGFVQPFSDTPLDDEPTGENVYLSAINNAKRYIYIYTPYLIPDNALNTALCIAAKKGIEVKIIVPGIPDKKIVYSMTKSYYRTLCNAGVEIYKYNNGFVHAKGFVCDDEVATLGTINLDFRSMCHHFECGCVFYNHGVIMKIKEDMTTFLKHCEKIEDYQRFRGFLGTTYHAILRLIAPLM